MTLIVDAGALYAQADADDPHHGAVTGILRSTRELFVTTEAVVAEADHLILRRLGIGAELDFLLDLVHRNYVVECLSTDELHTARELVLRYRDLELGLGDASLIVVARRYGTRRLLTLDERDFRAVAPLQGGAFTLLPSDA